MNPKNPANFTRGLFKTGENKYSLAPGYPLTTNLPEICATATRRAPGVQSAEKIFEINCHNVMLGTVVLSIRNRFSDHKELYITRLLTLIDPDRFNEVKTHPEIINLTTIAEALPLVDTVSLKEKL
jgi:hypothetical protein